VHARTLAPTWFVDTPGLAAVGQSRSVRAGVWLDYTISLDVGTGGLQIPQMRVSPLGPIRVRSLTLSLLLPDFMYT
jgi:hypothetical protein